jgi:GGDEF domain-containing protein
VGHVTISIGAVSYDEGEAVNELIKRLDKNMYIAKESGRNQVIG